MRVISGMALGFVLAATTASAETAEHLMTGKIPPYKADYGALVFAGSHNDAALTRLETWAASEAKRKDDRPCYDGPAQQAVNAGLGMAQAAKSNAAYQKRRSALLNALAEVEARIPAEIERRAGPDPNAMTKRLAAMAGPDQVWRFALFRDRPDLSELTEAGQDAYRAFVTFRICRIDEKNIAEMRKILAETGWPRISAYGERADNLAWLLVQHADRHPDFQRAVLKTLAKLRKMGETAPKHYAYLYDRIAVRENRPQRFATQMQCIDGEYDPGPLEEPGRIDEVRAQVGLPPLAEYMKNFPESCEKD